MVIGLVVLVASGFGAGPLVSIGADCLDVGMGRTVSVTVGVSLEGRPLADAEVLPYVNGLRWGAHERADVDGKAVFLLPLPNPGVARIQAAVRVAEPAPLEGWVWTASCGDGQQVFLQTTFAVSGSVGRAALRVAVDDSCDVFLNGALVGSASGWTAPAVWEDCAGKCRAGENTLSVAARNGTGPAGVLARLDIEGEAGHVKVVSDGAWRAWSEVPAGWPGLAGGGEAVVGICGLGEGVWGTALGTWPGIPDRADLFVGRAVRADAVLSDAVEVTVRTRAITRPPFNPERIVCAQWEPWFMPGVCQWQTAQAVPVIGFYNSDNVDVIRQHALWLTEAGVDFVLADWSNHIWGKQHWSERDASVNEIIRATTATLDVYAQMRAEGIPVPKMVLMPGLSNGPPTTMQAMNEELQWIAQEYLDNPRYEGLWLDYEGKPLVVILDCGIVAQKETTPVDDTRFTVRWMSTQLQKTRHEKFGYWSWMDGSIAPILTYYRGAPEVITVSTAFFGDGGWLYPEAYGRRGGATYLDTFRPALAEHPRFLMLHQFNEFAGQPEGSGFGEKHDIYVDSYSVELSDDFEPVSLTAHAYRGEGGWGYYYLNLSRALGDLYRANPVEDTILAVSRPIRGEVVRGDTLTVAWSAVGKPAEGFAVELDGKEAARVSREDASCTVSLAGVPAGAHTIKVIALGTQTHYLLSYTREDDPLEEPVAASGMVRFVSD